MRFTAVPGSRSTRAPASGAPPPPPANPGGPPGRPPPLAEDSVAHLEALYDARGGEIRVEQSSLADPAVAALLTRRGFTLAGYENVLGLSLTPEVVAAFARECDASRARGIEIAAAAED